MDVNFFAKSKKCSFLMCVFFETAKKKFDRIFFANAQIMLFANIFRTREHKSGVVPYGNMRYPTQPVLVLNLSVSYSEFSR